MPATLAEVEREIEEAANKDTGLLENVFAEIDAEAGVPMQEESAIDFEAEEPEDIGLDRVNVEIEAAFIKDYGNVPVPALGVEDRDEKISAAPELNIFQKASDFLDTTFSSREARIADAQIKKEAHEAGMPKEKYMRGVYPQGEMFRRTDRLLKGAAGGALGTIEGMAGSAEWLSGGAIGKDLADQAAQWRQELRPEEIDFSDELASGVGSMATFFLPGLGVGRGMKALSTIAPKVAAWAGVGMAAIPAIEESLVEAGSVYRDTMARTKDIGQAEVAATKTFFMNLPATYITNKLGVFSETGGTIKKGVVSAITESAQESSQEIISDVAQGKDINWDNVKTSASVAAVTGAAFGGGEAMYRTNIEPSSVIPENQAEESFAFENVETEARYKASKGVPEETFLDKTKQTLENIKHKTQRVYEHLPRTKEYAQLKTDLLRLEKQKSVSSDKAIRGMKDITSGLDSKSYDVFTRKVIVDDLYESSLKGQKLPFGFTEETITNEKARVEAEAMASPAIQEALEKREALNTAIKTDYLAAMKGIGTDVSSRFQNEHYFRHQVLEYVNAKGLYGTGKKLKTPTGRGFLKKREGSTLDINTDYIQAEYEVLSQMIHDTEVAKTIKAVDKNYNKTQEIKERYFDSLQGLAESLGMNVREIKTPGRLKTMLEETQPGILKSEGLSKWEDTIPEGFKKWQPREGNMFYQAYAIPEQMAEDLMSGALQEAGVKAEDVDKVVALGRKRKELVVKDEVADTLDNLKIPHSQNMLINAEKKIIKGWKVWSLHSPRRFPKYSLRNLSGDVEAVFVGNPKGFKKTPRAFKELYGFFYKGKEMSQDMQDWFDMGGMQSTFQAQELGEVNKLDEFLMLQEKKGITSKHVSMEAWKKYWNTTRKANDFREGVLRYGNYLSYKEQIETSPDNMPDNFGASMPEEITGIQDTKQKAFTLSNELLGAYDEISVAGKAMREHLYPFWSWKEVNFKRYIQMAKNAADSAETAEMVGRKTIGTAASPYNAYRTGKFLIRASAFWAALQAYNHTVFPEEEKDLPEEKKARPHIILGRDKDGKVLSFDRVGMLGDFLEWFGLDAAPKYVDQWARGTKTLKEIAIDMSKSPVNIFAQGARPVFKTTGEVVTRRALFPDVFNPRTVRDRGLHIARSLGMEHEYRAMAGKPSRRYKETLPLAVIYKTDPGQVAYSNIFEAKQEYLKSIGKYGEGFWLTPKGDALYNWKLAIRYKDKTAEAKYLKEYINEGGTAKGAKMAIKKMNPVAGLSKEDTALFLGSLDEEGKEDLNKAAEFYFEVLLGGEK